jgi:hypothetical protein
VSFGIRKLLKPSPERITQIEERKKGKKKKKRRKKEEKNESRAG